MKTRIIITAAILLTVLTAQARIGENVQQSLDRYGHPVPDSGLDKSYTGVNMYQKNGLRIKIHFNKGLADSIEYLRGPHSALNLEAALRLLQLNGGARTWELLVNENTHYKLDGIKGREYMQQQNLIRFDTTDQALFATYSKQSKSLKIETSSFINNSINYIIQGL